MLGLRILIHSVKLVASNWQAALRISSPFVAVMITAGIFLEGGGIHVDFMSSDPNFPWFLFFATLLAFAISMLWVAVLWHRFILLEEDKGSLMPSFPGRQIGAYFLQGLILFIILFVVSLALGFGLGALGGALGGFVGVILATVAVSTIAMWVFYRYSPTLPAAALGRQISIDAAWRETKPLSGAIFVLVLLLSMVNYAYSNLIVPYISNQLVIPMVVEAVATWLSLMISISVLTTIYGIAIEKRAL